jgi:TetR/AcrR family transcriptional regulator, transcriptional repressor for nem operon
MVSAFTKHLEGARAKQRYAPSAPRSPECVGYFKQCVLQGAFILWKAKQSPEIAAASLGHLRSYLVTLLGQPRNHKHEE